MGTNNGAAPEYAGALSQVAEDICKTEMPQMQAVAAGAFLISGLSSFSRWAVLSGCALATYNLPAIGGLGDSRRRWTHVLPRHWYRAQAMSYCVPCRVGADILIAEVDHPLNGALFGVVQLLLRGVNMRVGNILALCVLTLLAGCATGGARYADVNVAAPKLAADRGRVYFYRTSILGFAVQPDIKLNGESVGSAAPGGFFFVDRPRGNYVASSTTEVESKLAFALAAGETKYVRTSISPGIIVGHMNFELVSKSVAEGELASLNQTAATAALR